MLLMLAEMALLRTMQQLEYLRTLVQVRQKYEHILLVDLVLEIALTVMALSR